MCGACCHHFILCPFSAWHHICSARKENSPQLCLKIWRPSKICLLTLQAWYPGMLSISKHNKTAADWSNKVNSSGVMPILFSTSSLPLPRAVACFTVLAALKKAAVALNPGVAVNCYSSLMH
ncbi:uncharacterized protein LOC104431850 isoform X1 [Eucalyptus grandis]|uniref:uncharacterized protein LOC104431850 isoform X1 n=1 Tax=Eucalyptus grandis TaxID=71139 RepID=UPI00192E8431|nr:uncharacterized protein LOC104431850 isoform X1 [Eucalyptus grandis]